MLKRLRFWWQVRTGEEETPFDGDVPAWVTSIFVHVLILVVIAVYTLAPGRKADTLVITSVPVAEEIDSEELDPDRFEFSDVPVDEAGSDSLESTEVALSVAPAIADISQVVSTQIPTTSAMGPVVDFSETFDMATGLAVSDSLIVKGRDGVGVTGASGAIDRLTHEINMSLKERDTLVVWLFDQSASLQRQRETIYQRFERIHEELGVIGATEKRSSRRTEPLLSAVIGFGEQVSVITPPTADVEKLKAAVAGIERDDSGVEKVFTAIALATNEYKRLRTRRIRNVMMIVFTDEVGEDQMMLEKCVYECRNAGIPVHVVGVPAPFGRKESVIKWVDPDPRYDQTPTRGVVDQGPESLFVERIKLASPGMTDDPLIDSGFGPFALTRLCYETGGIYFAVHPKREVGVDIRDTEAYSSYFRRFFDPRVMRKYRPDYVSYQEYEKNVRSSAMRMALVNASMAAMQTNFRTPRLRFVRRDEAALANALTEAQKTSAVLEPKLNALFATIKSGESDRRKEEVRRWQAGYDLAYGRALAAKVRTEAYNAILANAKSGLNFKNEKNNTWILKPSDDLQLSSQITKNAKKATEYLNRVVQEHPGTPWAYLAENELKTPLGYAWTETYTNLQPRRPPMGGNNNNPADDKLNMLQRKPKRPAPKKL